VSGPTSCSSSTGLLAAATCTTAVWISRNAVPQQSYMPAQGAGTYDTFMYTYIAGPQLPMPANRGEFYKYSSAADTWTSGGARRERAVCRASAAPRERYSEYPLARRWGRRMRLAAVLAVLPVVLGSSTATL
jgi:hypothetical protein